jgi:uncharacterized protein (TIGR02246 family)
MKQITFFASLLFIGACNQAEKSNTKSEEEKIIQLSKDWSKVASAGDLQKTVEYWADDAVLIAPYQGVLKSKEEIRQMVEGSFNTPGFKISWEPQNVFVSQSGDLAYMIEKSQISFTDSTGKTVTELNNGVTVWKKQPDGSWKNVVDISSPAANN